MHQLQLSKEVDGGRKEAENRLASVIYSGTRRLMVAERRLRTDVYA